VEWRRLVVTCSVSGVQVHDARLVAAMHAYGLQSLLTLTLWISAATRTSLRFTPQRFRSSWASGDQKNREQPKMRLTRQVHDGSVGWIYRLSLSPQGARWLLNTIPHHTTTAPLVDVLYHYCGVQSFLDIIRSKSLHLTSIHHMNDYLEHNG